MTNTDKRVEALFQPFKYGKLEIANRIAMAPMTRSFSPGNIPGENVADYYAARAKGGVGLIITEGTFIGHLAANGYPNVPAFFSEKALDGWKKVAEAVHKNGGKIAPQIWHTGPFRRPGMQPNPDVPGYGPSEIIENGEIVVKKMTKQDIDDVIEAFANAAKSAEEAGFDAVEIHGAHQYLIDSFLWEGSNKRDDEYGGSIENRTRFAVEIAKAVRASVSKDFPVIFRYSQWKQADYSAKLAQNPKELAQILLPLKEAGVDIFHASVRRFWEAEFEGSDKTLAAITKEITGQPVVTVGSIGLSYSLRANPEREISHRLRTPDNVDEIASQRSKGYFDIAAVGRALLSDPEWPAKLREGRRSEIIPYTDEALKSLIV